MGEEDIGRDKVKRGEEREMCTYLKHPKHLRTYWRIRLMTIPSTDSSFSPI